MSGQIWTPGMAGPLDEFVKRVNRMVEAFGAEHGLEEVEVRLELADGSLYLLRTLAAEPGFGFLSVEPYRGEREEPRRLLLPIGAVKTIELSAPDPEQAFGFAASEV